MLWGCPSFLLIPYWQTVPPLSSWKSSMVDPDLRAPDHPDANAGYVLPARSACIEWLILPHSSGPAHPHRGTSSSIIRSMACTCPMIFLQTPVQIVRIHTLSHSLHLPIPIGYIFSLLIMCQIVPVVNPSSLVYICCYCPLQIPAVLRTTWANDNKRFKFMKEYFHEQYQKPFPQCDEYLDGPPV